VGLSEGTLNLKNYTKTSKLGLFKTPSALDGRDIYSGWISKKHHKNIKPTYIKNNLKEGPSLDGKMIWRMK
jgi:hypothetical protein